MDEGGAAAGAAENRPVDLGEDLQAPFEPADCGLSAYRARVGKDDWEALVAEETWRVRGILEDRRASRRAVCGPRWAGWRGASAATWCRGCPAIPAATSTGASARSAMPASPTRTSPAKAAPVEEFIERTLIARLPRPDAADLVTVPEGGPDVVGLRRTRRRSRATWRRWPLTAR